MKNNTVTLIGAGLAGSLLAIYLARRGFQIELYEWRPDMRKTAIPAGRSINLALSTRGIYALQEVDLEQEILSLTIPMKGRMIHSLDASLLFQPYSKNKHEFINSISRAGLNMLLLETAEQKYNVQTYFNEKCIGMNIQAGEVHLQNTQTGQTRSLKTEHVIATDGAGSPLRASMQRTPRFNFSQSYLLHSYKELTIPAQADGSHRLEKNALHIWPRRSYMLIALPNLDGTFTVTLFLPYKGEKGETSFTSLKTITAVEEFFQAQFPDAYPLMPTLTTDFFQNPTGDLATIRCSPWHVSDKLLLLGDAAHAIVPFFGQGMNAAFEDCTILNTCLEQYGNNWKQVFQEFEKTRIANANAIADMALQNFIEMRDHTADEKFHLIKQVENILQEKYPGRFIPKYSMVSFQRIPYQMALKRGIIQENILQELCKSIKNISELDWNHAKQLINQHLAEFP